MFEFGLRGRTSVGAFPRTLARPTSPPMSPPVSRAQRMRCRLAPETNPRAEPTHCVAVMVSRAAQGPSSSFILRIRSITCSSTCCAHLSTRHARLTGSRSAPEVLSSRLHTLTKRPQHVTHPLHVASPALSRRAPHAIRTRRERPWRSHIPRQRASFLHQPSPP